MNRQHTLPWKERALEGVARLMLSPANAESWVGDMIEQGVADRGGVHRLGSACMALAFAAATEPAARILRASPILVAAIAFDIAAMNQGAKEHAPTGIFLLTVGLVLELWFWTSALGLLARTKEG
jgi:hypothetical protein